MVKNKPTLDDYFEPPENLVDLVLFRVNKEKKIQSIRKKIIFAGGVLTATIILGAWLLIALNDFAGFSSVGQLLNLTLTDKQAVMTYWYNFSLAVIEVLPIDLLIICLSLTFVALITIYSILNKSKEINNLRRSFKPILNHA